MDDSKFWAEWERRYSEEGKALAKDGAGDGYAALFPRILVVLKDPNKSPGADLRQDFLNSGPKWTIWHMLADWVAGILGQFPPYEVLRYDTATKTAALRRIAVMNLKKLSGGASIDDATVHRYAFRDRDLLRSQIEQLNPTVILACGTFEPLLWLLDERIPKVANLDAPVVSLADGAILVRCRHPARSTGADYDRLRETLGPHLATILGTGGPVTPVAGQVLGRAQAEVHVAEHVDRS